MTLDLSAFIGKFVEEARDRLKALTAALLRLEQRPVATEAVAELLRQTHSLKGSARMLGLGDISQVAHQLEDLFAAARHRPALLDGAAFDIVFGAIDALALRVEQLASGMNEPANVEALCERLRTLVEGAPAAPAPDGAAEAPPTPEAEIEEVRESLRVPVDKLRGLTNLAAEMVLQSLKAADRHREIRRIEAALRHVRDRVREARLEPRGALGDLGATLADSADALDTLSRRLRRFAEELSDDRVHLALITEELRQHVITLTMLPLATVFDAFPRAVRDLARQFGKRVDLVVRGRTIELDKKIIEQIADPLVHLVRNAVDHGIEPLEERSAQGKPPVGRLTLAAEQQGNRILIVVRDDGRGIDPAVLKAAAVRGGVATAQEIERWRPGEVLDLVFRPGFSTRPTVTDISGRGVGMDVVRDVVTRLGGAVRLHSEVGRGTTVVLDLPLSLALLQVVLVEAGGELFAVPTAAVRRLVRLSPEEIRPLQQGPVVDVGEGTVPLVVLATLLGLPAGPPPARQPVLVVEAADTLLAVAVDAIREDQELVFTELRGPVRRQRLFAGASLLGNGEIVPIVDITALVDLAGRAVSPPAAPGPGPRGAPRPGRILVVEDSLVAGELQKNILVAAGYQADIARDGIEALEKLLERDWDLVIADVDMPRLDGLELTARLRADARWRHLPVVIVTARDALEERRRGIEVGADAYIVKREFDQAQLLDTVRRLIGRAHEVVG